MSLWVHMKTASLNENLRAILRSRERNELSVTLNVGNTQAIVKIAGANQRVIYSLGVDHADVIRVYTDRDRHEIFDDVGFYTPAWQAEEGGDRVRGAREIQPLMMAEVNLSLWKRVKNWAGIG